MPSDASLPSGNSPSPQRLRLVGIIAAIVIVVAVAVGIVSRAVSASRVRDSFVDVFAEGLRRLELALDGLS